MKKFILFYSVLLLLSGCTASMGESVPPLTPAPAPSETLPVVSLPAATPPAETPYPATALLVAENGTYELYFTDRTEDGDYDVLGFELRDASGVTLQRLEERTDSNAASPDRLAAFEDLNFDGHDDIKIAYSTIRYPEYDAFLWDPAAQRFYEERSFIQISAPVVAEPYIFGEGSSGAAHSYLFYYSYDTERGYIPRGMLSVNSGVGITSDEDLDTGWGEALMDEEGRLISVKRCLNGKELDPIWTKVAAAYYDKWGDPCADEDISSNYFENSGPYRPVLEAGLAYSEILHGNFYPLADEVLTADLKQIFLENRERYLGMRMGQGSYYSAPWEYRRLVTTEQLEHYDAGRLALRLVGKPDSLWMFAYEEGKVISVDLDETLRESLLAEDLWWPVSLP